jgi:hypothetical protein
MTVTVGFTILDSRTFPPSTTIRAYLASQFPGTFGPPQEGTAPTGLSASATATVNSHNEATLSGLTAETQYFVGGQVEGTYRWIGIRSGAEPIHQGETGPAGPTGAAGERGERGERGEAGATGPIGAGLRLAATHITSGGESANPSGTGEGNTSFGFAALGATTTGKLNAALGVSALEALTTGEKQVALGAGALAANTTQSASVAVGYNALHAKKGVGAMANTAVGAEAMAEGETGERNTAIGYQTLKKVTGAGNVGIGYQIGTAMTSAAHNVVIGYESGENITTAQNNVVIGYLAGKLLATGEGNVLIGYRSQATGVAGLTRTVAIGQAAMDAGASSKAVCVGYEAGGDIEGEGQVCLGYETQASAGAGTSFTVAVGYQACHELESAEKNVAVGAEAIPSGAAGHNVALGHRAGLHGGGEANVYLGFEAGPAAGPVSNQLYIHNASSSEPLIFGNFSERLLRVFNEKLGFYKHAAIAQPSELIGVLGYEEVGGGPVKSESKWTGGVGAKKYSIGGIVKAMKELGLIAE